MLPMWLPHSRAGLFYSVQVVMLLVCYLGVWCLGSGDQFRQLLKFKVLNRPTWMPAKLNCLLLRSYVFLPVVYSLPCFLVLAAFYPDYRVLRAAVAVTSSMYCLAEASTARMHTNYNMMYNAWALALLPERWASAVSLGIVVYFLLCTGVSKLFIAGGHWFDPCTMRSYMEYYSNFGLSDGGPYSPTLSRYIMEQDLLLTGTTVLTLVLETLCPVMALAMIPAVQVSLFISMALLHVGIFVVLSVFVGLMFLPNVASYLLGLSASLTIGSTEWFVALVIGGSPLISIALSGWFIPENWPLSPFPLFAWPGAYWDAILEVLHTRDTRLVLTTDPNLDPVGVPVLTHYMRACDELSPPFVYNGFYNLFDETNMQRDVFLALDPGRLGKHDWDANACVASLEVWLKGQRRLVEISSCEALIKAFFVRIDKAGTIVEVIADGTGAVYSPPKLP